MAIAVRSSSPLASGTRTSSTVPMPAGVAAGDVVLVGLGAGVASLSAPTITPPATLTGNLVDETTYGANDPWWLRNVLYLYRVTGSGDPTSFIFTHASASTDGWAVAFTGVDSTTPIDVAASANNGYGTTATTGSITTVTPNAMLIAVRGSWDGNPITPPSGWGESIDQPISWVGTKLQATAGATGAVSIPSGNGGGYPYSTMLAALRPSTGGGTAYTGTPADSEALSDAVVDALDSVRNPADPQGLTDSVSDAMTMVRAASDPQGMTDSVGLGRATTAADQLGLTDAVTFTLGAGQSPADALGATDATALGRGTSPSDPLGLSDVLAAILAANEALADALGLVDSVNAVLTTAGTLTGTPSDPLGLTDALTATTAATRTPADPLGLTDSVSAVLDRVVTVADLLGLIDAAQGAKGPVANPADPLGITDTPTWSLSTARPLSDPLALSDQATAVALLERTVVDLAGLTDTVTVVYVDGSIPPLPDHGILVPLVPARTITAVLAARTMSADLAPRGMTAHTPTRTMEAR